MSEDTPRTYVEVDDLAAGVAVLTGAEFDVERRDAGLLVTGQTPQLVGALLFRAGLGVSHLRRLERTLEETYFTHVAGTGTAATGGMLPAAVLSSVCEVLAGGGAVAALTFFGRADTTRESIAYVTPPVEVAGFVAIALLSVSVVVHTGRSVQSGSVTGALLLQPARSTLLVARAAAVSSVVGVSVFVATTTVALLALAFAGSTAWVDHVLLAVVVATTAGALVSCVSVFVSFALGRAVPALLVFFALWLLAPVALGIAGASSLPWLARLAAAAVELTPASSLSAATTVSTAPVQGCAGIALGQLGLLVWSGALGVLALSIFRRRSM